MLYAKYCGKGYTKNRKSTPFQHKSTCEFDVILLDDSHEKVVREWLDYGILRGIGQWRNSGKGRFTYIAYEVKA